MRYRTLGRTGIEVSVLSLGAMSFGKSGNRDRAECITMIHDALDAGINLIDTADVYSDDESEEIVGEALQGRRDEVFIATKFGYPRGRNQGGASRAWILQSVEGSLRRLGTDHIDLYQQHVFDDTVAPEETLAALRAAPVQHLRASHRAVDPPDVRARRHGRARLESARRGVAVGKVPPR